MAVNGCMGAVQGKAQSGIGGLALGCRNFEFVDDELKFFKDHAALSLVLPDLASRSDQRAVVAFCSFFLISQTILQLF
jgi:hypothetical protein